MTTHSRLETSLYLKEEVMLKMWEKAQVKTWEIGQGLVEYALILVLVAVVVIVILALLGPAIGNVFSTIVEEISSNPVTPP